MADNFAAWPEARGLDPQICFAKQAKRQLALSHSRLLADLGAAFDVASGGELPGPRLRRRTRSAASSRASAKTGGGDLPRPGQRDLRLSRGERARTLARINHVAGKLAREGPWSPSGSIPDVDAHTHAKISTGKSEHKFGHPAESSPGAVYEAASKYPHIALRGVRHHIGSQIQRRISAAGRGLVEQGRPPSRPS